MKAMFKSMRSRSVVLTGILLFIFGCIMTAYFNYQKRNKQLSQLQTHIKYIASELQNIKRLERDFLWYESNNFHFYETGESIYVKQHENALKLLKKRLKELKEGPAQGKKIVSQLNYFNNYLERYQQQFDSLVMLRKVIGFEDYGLIGEIRRHIHKVEHSGYPYEKARMLTLRRHEKDYLLRAKDEYVQKHQKAARAFIARLKAKSFRPAEKQKIIKHLKAYKRGFTNMVKLSKKMGHSATEGLQGRLSEQYTRMEIGIARIKNLVSGHIAEVSKSNRQTFLGLLLGGMLLSLLVTVLILRNLVRPVRRLSASLQSLTPINHGSRLAAVQTTQVKELAQIAADANHMLTEIHHITDQLKVQKDANQKLTKDMARLFEAGMEILQQNAVEQILNVSYTHLNALIEAPYVSLGIYSREKNGLEFFGKETSTKNIRKGFDSLQQNNFLSVYAFSHNHIIFSNNIDEEFSEYVEELLPSDKASRRNSVIFIPLANAGKIYGLLTVQNKQKDAYTKHDLHIVQYIAGFIAHALHNQLVHSVKA